jgi:uncharacterized membrane protein (UPF0127 family)
MKYQCKSVRALASFVWITILAGMCACSRTPAVVLFPAAGDPGTVTVELARAPAELARGLMYRRELAELAGMLFLFPETRIQSFWMKDTPLPLDMIFIGDDMRIVGIVENAVPFTTSPRTVGEPSRYVLEVNAGFSKRHGIKAGDRIEFRNLPSRT